MVENEALLKHMIMFGVKPTISIIKTYDDVWSKANNSIKIEFHSEPEYKKKISENKNKALRR